MSFYFLHCIFFIFILYIPFIYLNVLELSAECCFFVALKSFLSFVNFGKYWWLTDDV